MLLVTKNRTDFCAKKGELHPDLKQDLDPDQHLDVVPSLYDLLQHEMIAPLAAPFKDLGAALTRERILELVDQAIANLHGSDVEEALGVYIGDGMFEVPISTGLDSPAFEEIMPDEQSIVADIYRAGDELTIRVRVDAECSFDGFIDKGEYFLYDDDDRYAFLENWNEYVFRASTSREVRFTLSATFTEDTQDEIALTVDEAEEL